MMVFALESKWLILQRFFTSRARFIFVFHGLFSAPESARGASARRSYFVVPERLSLARNNILIFTAK
jgi:hypothetical protein